MGKLVVSEFISLDGVIEDPGGGESTDFGGWTFQFPAPEGQVAKWEELVAADAQLLGRVTYEGFAEAWPAMVEVTGEFGAKMNGMPKFVVSTTLDTAAWNNSTVVNGDLAAIVADLKARFSRCGRRVPPRDLPDRPGAGQEALQGRRSADHPRAGGIALPRTRRPAARLSAGPLITGYAHEKAPRSHGSRGSSRVRPEGFEA